MVSNPKKRLSQMKRLRISIPDYLLTFMNRELMQGRKGVHRQQVAKLQVLARVNINPNNRLRDEKEREFRGL